MSMYKNIAASAALTVTLGAGAASAATYDLYREHASSWFGTNNPIQTQMTIGTQTTHSQIGGYDIKAVSKDGSDTVWNFVAWCVEVLVPLATDLDTYITTSSTSTSEAARLTPDASRFDDVELLFKKAYDETLAEDRIQSAGFQLAIWELLYETESTLDASSGFFRATEYTSGASPDLTAGTDEMAARTAANAFLDIFEDEMSPVNDYDFLYFTNLASAPLSQALINATPVPPVSEVPLPAPAFLLVGGLVAMGAMRRRRD